MPPPKRRGPQPQDAALFGADALPVLRCAVEELSWLFSHGYADSSSLKLVGDRHQLVARQRQAVLRSACSDEAKASRESRRLPISEIRDRRLAIDGFNLIITLETLLGNGVLLKGRDGCVRDLASLNGNYRLLEDTAAVIDLVYRGLERLRPALVHWWLDEPVSNSGQIKAMLESAGAEFEFSTLVSLVPDPDKALLEGGSVGFDVIATADSGILSRCGLWVNLASYLIATVAPEAPVLALGDG